MFVGVVSKKYMRIKASKLTYHPIRVGAYPKYDSNIMAYLTHILSISVCDNDGNNECRKDHSNTKRAQNHTPADIFKQPKNNMKVFNFSVADGNVVSFFCQIVNFIEGYCKCG
jgi:hypothetical protein